MPKEIISEMKRTEMMAYACALERMVEDLKGLCQEHQQNLDILHDKLDVAEEARDNLYDHMDKAEEVTRLWEEAKAHITELEKDYAQACKTVAELHKELALVHRQNIEAKKIADALIPF